MVGIVVGIGIFKTPALVAANVSSEFAFIAVWVAGGLITLIGALCYAELASAHPHAGGEASAVPPALRGAARRYRS
ncbi:amino acid permease [Bosea sp. RCC_152_1]|uniref:amino acid permease n=1 Tax=Bosea sp. RCC_152_1 TaxID=3239228 RepID=UPI003523CA56